MNTYELMLMYHSNLKESDVKAHIEEVKEKIKSFDGEVISEDYWGKKKLSYEINRQSEAYYTVLTYNLSALKSNDVTAYLNHEESVLRSMVSVVNNSDSEK